MSAPVIGCGDTQRELRSDQAAGAGRCRQLLAEEHGREDHADEQPGQRAPDGEDALGEQAALPHRAAHPPQDLRAEEQQDDTGDDRAGQEELLRPAGPDPDDLSQE
jgi:hypothetical protein